MGDRSPGSYPPGWEPNDPPDDLDLSVAEDMQDPDKAHALTLAMQVQHEPLAPVGERCDEMLHVGPTGVWRCQRQRGHVGACFARGVVDV